MAITNLYTYWRSKSIKLSDTFEALIKYTDSSNFETLVNCTGFTIPKLEYDEETYEYGNVSQVFVTPKYDSAKELTLDFYERMENKNFSVVLSKIFKYMNFELTQKFGTNWLDVNKANYNMDKYISTLDIKILDNKLWRYIYKYHFENLKITNYTMYNLDYQSDSPCTVSVTFSFETYKREIINEKVQYPVQKDSKINSTEPAKIDYEQEWKKDINEEDLNTINGLELQPPPSDEEIASYEAETRTEDLDEEQRLKQESYNKMMESQSRGRDRGADISTPKAYEEGQWATIENAEEERQAMISQEPPSEQPYEPSNERIGQQTGGYRGPQGPTSNPSVVANVTENYTQQENQPKLTTEPKIEKTAPKYSTSEIQEMAKRAAEFDKNTGVKKGKTGTYYAVGANEVGLDEQSRKEFEQAYKSNFS